MFSVVSILTGILLRSSTLAAILPRVSLSFSASLIPISSAEMPLSRVHVEGPRDGRHEAVGDRCPRQDPGESCSNELVAAHGA